MVRNCKLVSLGSKVAFAWSLATARAVPLVLAIASQSAWSQVETENLPKAINMEASFLLLNTDVQGGFLSMTLVQDADSMAESTVNLDKQEIGRYRCKLTENHFRECNELFRSSGFSDLQPPAELRPTTPTIAIGSGKGKVVDLKSFPLDEIPEQLRPFVLAMKKSLDKIRENRLRVLSGEASCGKAIFATNEPLVFRIVLSNSGIETLKFRNPLVGEDRFSSLTMLIKESGTNESSEPTSVDIAKSNLSMGEISEEIAAKNRNNPVTLLADEKYELRLTKKLFLRPGSYRAAITIHLTKVKPDDPSEIIGALTMQTPEFSVKSE